VKDYFVQKTAWQATFSKMNNCIRFYHTKVLKSILFFYFFRFFRSFFLLFFLRLLLPKKHFCGIIKGVKNELYKYESVKDKNPPASGIARDAA